jgi:hypothetical protein
MMFATTIGSSGFAYSDNFLGPMKVNHLFLFCENTYLAEFPFYGILPAPDADKKIDYQKHRVISFNEKYPDPCPNSINS